MPDCVFSSGLVQNASATHQIGSPCQSLGPSFNFPPEMSSAHCLLPARLLAAEGLRCESRFSHVPFGRSSWIAKNWRCCPLLHRTDASSHSLQQLKTVDNLVVSTVASVEGELYNFNGAVEKPPSARYNSGTGNLTVTVPRTNATVAEAAAAVAL